MFVPFVLLFLSFRPDSLSSLSQVFILLLLIHSWHLQSVFSSTFSSPLCILSRFNFHTLFLLPSHLRNMEDEGSLNQLEIFFPLQRSKIRWIDEPLKYL